MSRLFFLLVTIFIIISKFSYANIEQTNGKINNLFSNFPIGLLQKDFKNIIPNDWTLSPSMHSYEQNVNPVGEVNNGYFFYEFNDDDLQLIRFKFWEKQLASIEITLFAFDENKSLEDNEILKKQLKNLNFQFGNPIEISDKEPRKYYLWEKDNISAEVRFYPKDKDNKQTVGSLEFKIINTNTFETMDSFSKKRDEIKYYDEYYTSIYCEQTLNSGNIFQFGFFYDTREFPKQLADEHKNNMVKNLSNEKTICQSELSQVSEWDKEWLDITLPNKKSVLDSYLYFKTKDGINAWGQFFAGEYTDAICSQYADNFVKSGLEAECVYGSDVR